MAEQDILAARREKVFSAAEHASLFALVDGAWVPELSSMLTGSPARSVCLLPGELSSEVSEVSPYLIQLDNTPKLSRWLIDQGSGRPWGILFITQALFRVVRQHTRSLLHAFGPQGEPLLLRFYDPRVLRALLTDCDQRQLTELFGPIECFLIESEHAGKLDLWDICEGKIRRR